MVRRQWYAVKALPQQAKRIHLMSSDMNEATYGLQRNPRRNGYAGNLVDVLEKFELRIVWMADARERPED